MMVGGVVVVEGVGEGEEEEAKWEGGVSGTLWRARGVARAPPSYVQPHLEEEEEGGMDQEGGK